MSELAIELRDVHKVFVTDSNRVEALAQISLQIAQGEFVSMIGPSGCGKTSLMRIVGDLETPTKGTVRVLGKIPEAARRERLVGFVFQHPSLLAWRTVEENVRLPAEVFGDAEILSRVSEMIDIVGLAGFEQAYPRELSGGMQSRVAIARVLTFRPSVLLMDEPFGALDEMTREKMQIELLRIWQATGAAVLFITHSISEALLLSDRRRGHVCQTPAKSRKTCASIFPILEKTPCVPTPNLSPWKPICANGWKDNPPILKYQWLVPILMKLKKRSG